MDLVTGPFRPELERAFARAFADLRRSDPLAPLAVVAPSRRLCEHLKRLALDALPEGFAAARFYNLFSFARAIHDETGFEGRVVLDDLLPARIVADLLKRHFSAERYLSRAALAPRALLSALHELKAAAVDPDAALSLLAFGDLGFEDAPKLAEILALYKHYGEELRRRGLRVRSDVVRAAAGAAPASPLVGGFRHVFYYGFYELDQNQLDLLREVARRVPVTLFFPAVETPGYAYARDFLREAVASLAQSERSLPASPPAPRVSRVAASGAHDEVWAAAKEILRLSDRGVPYSEIAVVARTLDPYADLVESVFREHSIPFVSSARRSLRRDPRVKAARLLFSLEDFDRADVMDLIRSPYFRRTGGDLALWDEASRQMGIGQGAEEWRRRLGAAAGADYRVVAGRLGEAVRFFMPREEVDLFWLHVRALLDSPPPPGDWPGFAAWALDRHRRFLEPDPRVEEAIASLAALEGLPMDKPGETLLELLDGLSEPAGGRSGVRVLDAMAARGLSFRALVVLGLNERVFPRFILEDAFLGDAFRSRLEHRLGCRMPRKVRGYDEERLLFTLLMGSAEEIVLCWQRSDEKGRLQIPSVFLSGGGPPRQIPRRPADRLRETPLELLTPREASLRTGQGEALGRAIGWDVSPLIRAGEFLRSVEGRGALTPHDGLVDAREYWQAVATRGISPTAVEKLAECPFRYFASKMLGLEELEEPEEEDALLPVETGAIYHEVLEKVHRGGELEEEMEAAFRRFEAARSVRYPVLWEVEKERIRGVLRAFVAQEDLSRFRPAEFEKELRFELPWEVGGRKGVVVRGFVDRLDFDGQGAFRVVDYKRRKSAYYGVSLETGIFKHRKYLQPALYFRLAQRMLGEAEGSEFEYAFVEPDDEGKFLRMTLGDKFAGRREEFDGLVRDLLETIPRGEFAIRPGEACARCEFATMCRKSHLPTRLRARREEVGEE